jgi:hypothetical protein
MKKIGYKARNLERENIYISYSRRKKHIFIFDKLNVFHVQGECALNEILSQTSESQQRLLTMPQLQ